MSGGERNNSQGNSMIEKSKRKKKIDDEHRKNYHAGAVDLNERQLHRTGIRGRKIFVIVFILMLLLLLFLANLTILLVVYYVENIGINGMKSISFFKNGKTKWFQDSDLAYVYPSDGVIGGFEKENILIDGDIQNVFIHGGPSGTSYPSITVGPSGSDIKVKKGFLFADPVAGKNVFHVDQNTKLKKEGKFVIKSLKASSIRTPRIISDDTTDLKFTGKAINVKGSEGLYVDSKDYMLQTNGDVSLTVEDSKSNFIAGSGVSLDRSKIKDTATKNHKVLEAHRYRLCGCANSGKLFRVRIRDGQNNLCSTAAVDPCA